MSALFVGLSARHLPLLSIVVGALGVALTARMAVMGVYTNGRELRCVSWFVSTRVPLAHVTAVRVVGYSGFGNRFSDSLLLSMLVIDREPDRAIVLRGTFGRFSTGQAACARDRRTRAEGTASGGRPRCGEHLPRVRVRRGGRTVAVRQSGVPHLLVLQRGVRSGRLDAVRSAAEQA
jgi:hypothetical protein